MLTVRIIDTLGDESIYQTKGVNAKTNRETRRVERLIFQTDSEEIELSGAYTVYVMNDSGKTVAKYFLGTKEAEAEKELE